MFAIKVKTLRDPVFHDAMRRVYTSDKIPGVKASFHIRKLLVALDAETTTANEVYKTLVNKYKEEKQEEGEDKIMIKKDMVETFNKEVAEMSEHSVDIDMRPIDASLLTKVALSPAHIAVMDDVVDWGNFE